MANAGKNVTPITKEEILKVIKNWEKSDSLKAVAEATGMHPSRIMRIVSLVRKHKPALLPKKTKRAYLDQLIKDTIADL